MIRKDDGMTLVELLTVLMILGILAGISTVAFTGSRANSEASACTTTFQAIRLAISSYQSQNNGAVPDTWTALSPGYLDSAFVTDTRFTIEYSKTASGATPYTLIIKNSGGVQCAPKV